MIETAYRFAAIGIGGALGAMTRYGVGLACARVWGDRFGYGTLLVNVVGCFVLGILMHEAWATGERLSPHTHVGLTVGLLGGLTTFSTFGYQTVRHFESGEPWLMLLNVLTNVVLGLLAAAAGLALAKALHA